jgi:hypothetical protein
MALLRWGSTGLEVEQVQQLLKQAGYYYGLVDGKFGPLTYSAVRRFQEANGLLVDGIVGPQTMAALTAGTSPSPTPSGNGEPAAGVQAMSVHIGMNRVDPAKYGGWDGVLTGCERDAQTMAAIARAEGFTPRNLFAPQATAEAILGEIQQAAQTLRFGDIFLLTYAGHGGQVSDPTGAEESDQKDETWVAFNRQIIDDELWQALSEFREGVNVVMVSDSCHSGSVNRYVPEEEQDREFQQQFAELKESYYLDLAAGRPGPGDPPFAAFPRPRAALSARTADVELRRPAMAAAPADATGGDGPTGPTFAPAPFVGTGSRSAVGDGGTRTRSIPITQNEVANQIQYEDLVRAKARARSQGTQGAVLAAGLLLSGCADNQLSQEVGGAGVFTTALNRVWANGGFSEDYERLIALVVSQMGPTQTPQLSPFGVNPQALAARTPFNTV